MLRPYTIFFCKNTDFLNKDNDLSSNNAILQTIPLILPQLNVFRLLSHRFTMP